MYQYNNNISNNENTKQACLTTIKWNEDDTNVYVIYEYWMRLFTMWLNESIHIISLLDLIPSLRT